MVTPTIDGPIYDEQLDADPTLAQAMSLFRTYATAQINGYPPSAAARRRPKSAAPRRSTPTARPRRPPTPPTTSAPGMPFNCDRGPGPAGRQRDPDGQPLAALLTANPASRPP